MTVRNFIEKTRSDCIRHVQRACRAPACPLAA
jgi:hypothetical protein